MQNHFESLDILQNLQIYDILKIGHQNGIIDQDHILYKDTASLYFIKSSHGLSEKN